ncbi:MAG: B12-binding domain-containing radical SAM protein [Anaerolineae bacterium]|jgi:radical SAM superfamily enzyme YgiQ (UPF0313 family)
MIVLYNPPSSAQRKPVLPLSLLALGALLEGEHDYRIVDGNLEPPEALEQTLEETGANVLGVTVMPGPQLSHAVPLCRRLKERFPHLSVVWGGYFPTQHYDACLRSGYVDYVVRGHGEMTFLALADKLRRGEEPGPLPGLAWRDPLTGQIHSQPPAPPPHPDKLPELPYWRVEMPRYLRPTFMGRRTVADHSSYGCPFSCSFCAVVNMAGGRWLPRSAARTAGTVARLVREWGADAVEFYDNNFFCSEERTAEFAQRIRPLGIGWWAEGRIDTMLAFHERTWETLRQSGLRMAFLGAESGSDEVLARMNKGGGARAEKTLEIAARMRQYGIVPEMSFVLGNPPDPEGDIRTTLEFIRRLKRVNPDTEVILYFYTPVPVPGELYEGAQAAGFRFPDTLEEWVSPAWQDFSQRRGPYLPEAEGALRRQVQEFERVLNAYYPTATDVRLRGPRRWLLRAAGAWRYHLRLYRYPLELRALNRLLRYQRPETSGF